MLLKNISIFYKFFIAFILFGFVIVFTLSFWFYSSSKSALIDRTFDQLKSVNVLKKQQLEKLFETHTNSIEDINEIMLETTGMGNTGETYLVDSNFKMFTISRFFPEKKLGTIEVKTHSSIDGFKKNSGWGIIKDYRKEDVFSVYSFVKLNNKPFVIISEIDYIEAIKYVIELRGKILWASVLILILLTFAAYYLSNIVVKRIKILEKPINQLAKGQIPAEYLEITVNDEIGEMMQSVNTLIKSFEKITTVAYEIGKGNLTYYFKPLSQDDSLSYSLLKMRHRLQELSEQEKTIQRQKTYLLLEGEERERKRLARELHDSLGQMLNGLRIRLDAINDDDQRKELKKITDDAIIELKQIINNLMPTVIIDFGLESAIKQFCDNIHNFYSVDIKYQYFKIDNPPDLTFETAIFIYRIIQEAINNIIKHAKATTINISIDKFSNKICLYIKDNGIGFDTQKEYKGCGIKNIHERVLLLQGSVEISSSTNGTIINIEIPLTYETH